MERHHVNQRLYSLNTSSVAHHLEANNFLNQGETQRPLRKFRVAILRGVEGVGGEVEKVAEKLQIILFNSIGPHLMNQKMKNFKYSQPNVRRGKLYEESSEDLEGGERVDGNGRGTARRDGHELMERGVEDGGGQTLRLPALVQLQFGQASTHRDRIQSNQIENRQDGKRDLRPRHTATLLK